MDILNLLSDLLFDYTLRTVALGTATLGVVAGALGSFAMLRRQSLLGDGISHAALPGVVLAFMLTGSKEPVTLLIGATIAGLLGMLFMIAITRYTRIKEDAALGIVLSVFFGFGLMLLTLLQRDPSARQAGLNTFLFGQAATLLERDVIVMAVFGGIALLLLILFWKEFKLFSFDPDYAASLGFPIRWLEVLVTGLFVIAIVIGLQTVGVVLMSAMIVAPAAAARQWTDHLGKMVLLAAGIGAFSGVSGALISSSGAGLSTGPVIVLVASVIVALSLLFANNRGILWRWSRERQYRREVRGDQVLMNLFQMAMQHDDPTHPHSTSALRIMSTRRRGITYTLNELADRGLVRCADDEMWALTTTGVSRARALVEQAQNGDMR